MSVFLGFESGASGVLFASKQADYPYDKNTLLDLGSQVWISGLFMKKRKKKKQSVCSENSIKATALIQESLMK